MVGNATRQRIFAFILDNLAGTILALGVVAVLKADNPYAGALALCLTYLGYFFTFEALWSRTPGKYFQGLVVVNLDGSRCGWRAALIRTLLRAVEANPLLFGGVPAGIAISASQRRQRLGDLAAGTLVVTAK